MSETKRLADQLERALRGDAWHGPSWKEVLDGIGVADALRKPVPNGHSIAEIVLHTTTWHDAAKRRFQGETPQVSDEQDWPRASFTTEEEWSRATTRLFDTGRALSEMIASFPENKLLEE